MENSTPIIYIVDDDESVRRGLSRLIRSSGLRSETYESADEFLENGFDADNGTAKCLVLDVTMPGLNGLELQQELGRRQIDTPIVFITGHGTIPMTVEAMKEGAIDFLSKPFNDEDLLKAVETALRQDIETRKKMAKSADTRERVASLTEREHEVLTHVITGKLNKQIADDLGVGEKTVKVHRGRMMQKMGIQSVAELVRLAASVGIQPAE